MEYLIVCLLWALYCILHSFLISTTVTSAASRILRKYYAFYRLFYVVVSVVLLIWLMDYTSQYSGRPVLTYSPLLDTIRQALMYAALLLFFWAFFFSYDVLSFFGIRQIMNMRKKDTGNTESGIRKNGLLGVIRHPMYLALIVYLWTQMFTLTDILVNSLLTAYVIAGTYLEEKKLILEFGESYIQYRQEVPMLIPFTRRKTAPAIPEVENRH